MLGLEYVVEVKLSPSDESFTCTLCTVDSDLPNIMSHLISSSHRLAYLARHFPTVSRSLSGQQVSQWTIKTFHHLDSIVARIVARFGVGRPTVVNNLLLWEREKENILRRIDRLDHARWADIRYLVFQTRSHLICSRETPDFNLATLPPGPF